MSFFSKKLGGVEGHRHTLLLYNYFGPSEVCTTSGAIQVSHYFRYFGPSGVRALPLAAGRNEGGHYFRYWSERVACASGAN